MLFVNYNDYELLYLIREGSEQAFNVLYHKYDVFIQKIINRYMPIGDKYYDLYQECLFVLINCIEKYNSYSNVSFFLYFKISVKRRISYLFKKKEYFDKVYFFDGNIGYNSNKETDYLIRNYHNFIGDYVDDILFNEHILGGCSLTYICNKYGFDYRTLYCKKKALLSKFKKALTN